MLARAGGLTTSATPSPLPSTSASPPHRAGAAAEAAPEGDGGAADAGAFAPLPAGTTPLLVYRAVDPQADAASVAAQIGFLAGVFEHAAFRVTAKGGEKAARAIAAQARDRFEPRAIAADDGGRRARGRVRGRRDRLAALGGDASAAFTSARRRTTT